MSQEYLLDDEHSFVAKLTEIVDGGVAAEDIRLYMPVGVPAVDQILKRKPSYLRVFSVAGALTGMCTGIALCVYTMHQWPLLVGGKAPVAYLPFMIIAFELTILFGAVGTMAGFLLLGRVPSLPTILEPVDYGNKFAIIVDGVQESPAETADSPA